MDRHRFTLAFYTEPAESRETLARRVVAALGPDLSAVGLSVAAYKADVWRSGHRRVFGTTALVHAGFAAATGNPLWGVAFGAISLAPELGLSLTTASIPCTPLAESWSWVREFGEWAAHALGADLALLNAEGPAERAPMEEAIPCGDELHPGGVPWVVCPWMYLGAARRHAAGDLPLSALPAQESRPSGDGWIVRAGGSFTDPPPPGFLEGWSGMAGRPAVWKQARLRTRPAQP